MSASTSTGKDTDIGEYTATNTGTSSDNTHNNNPSCEDKSDSDINLDLELKYHGCSAFEPFVIKMRNNIISHPDLQVLHEFCTVSKINGATTKCYHDFCEGKLIASVCDCSRSVHDNKIPAADCINEASGRYRSILITERNTLPVNVQHDIPREGVDQPVKKAKIHKSLPGLRLSPTPIHIVPFDIEGSRKKQLETIMVLPRQNQRKHLKEFSLAEKGLFHNKIDSVFCKRYTNLQRDHEKFDYITNVILTWKTLGFRVIKCHDKDDKLQGIYYEVSTSELYSIITQRMKKVNRAVKNSAMNLSSDQSTTAFQTFVTNNKLMSIYGEEDLFTVEKIKDWTYLSLLHSLFSSFNFYVYAYSHRIKPGREHVIHRCTKLKLHFPDYPSMFIIFHGRTVHSGAESKMVSLSSSQPSHDTRLFCYITMRNNLLCDNRRSAAKGKGPSGKVDRDGLFVCNENQTCPRCDSRMSEDVFDIDLLHEYEAVVKSRRKRKLKTSSPFRIVGDIDEYGFEVWHGQQSRTIENINLKNDVYFLRDTKNWKKLDDNTDRMVFDITALKKEQILSPGRKCNNIYFKSIDRFVGQIGDIVNSEVFQTRHCELGPVALLSNFGCCQEQLRHRDHRT